MQTGISQPYEYAENQNENVHFIKKMGNDCIYAKYN